MFPDTPSHKWGDFKEKYPSLKDVSLHGLRHSYCSMQMNENPNLSPAGVKKLMGHSQLSTTFIYTHSNEDKKEEAISVFDKYYKYNNEKTINFNEMLSLYTGKHFTTTSIIDSYINFLVTKESDVDNKNKLIREYIDTKYPFFKNIDISLVNINNIWDWLEEMKKKYGNEFIICPIE